MKPGEEILNYEDIPANPPRSKKTMVDITKEELTKIRDYPFLERCGRRLESNNVIVRQTSNGQFHTTIPKAIASSLGLVPGSILRFEIQAYGGVKLSWKNPTSRVFEGGK